MKCILKSVGNLISDNFPTQNCLKQGAALLPLLFNFTLDHAVKKGQRKQVGLKMNGTYQLLSYSDNVNLPGDMCCCLVPRVQIRIMT
jgi:hypothetical protein